jgi:hypothetical protein
MWKAKISRWKDSAEGRLDRFAELARNVVTTQPDLIYAMSGPLALVFKWRRQQYPLSQYPLIRLHLDLSQALHDPAVTLPASV